MAEINVAESNVAEIRVERNERRSLLPWILGLALLALVLWGVAEMRDDDARPADGSAEVGVVIEPQPPALRQMASAPSGAFAEAA